MNYPDLIFEVSWEVCNKVGGIYTVLSTHTSTLQSKMGQNLIFVGPDIWKNKNNNDFVENDSLCKEWQRQLMRLIFLYGLVLGMFQVVNRNFG